MRSRPIFGAAPGFKFVYSGSGPAPVVMVKFWNTKLCFVQNFKIKQSTSLRNMTWYLESKNLVAKPKQAI